MGSSRSTTLRARQCHVDVEGYFTVTAVRTLYGGATANLRHRWGTLRPFQPLQPVQCEHSRWRHLTIEAAGLPDVPSSASAIAVNVTTLNETASGYLTIYPCGSSRTTTLRSTTAVATIRYRRDDKVGPAALPPSQRLGYDGRRSTTLGTTHHNGSADHLILLQRRRPSDVLDGFPDDLAVHLRLEFVGTGNSDRRYLVLHLRTDRARRPAAPNRADQCQYRDDLLSTRGCKRLGIAITDSTGHTSGVSPTTHMATER